MTTPQVYFSLSILCVHLAITVISYPIRGKQELIDDTERRYWSLQRLFAYSNMVLVMYMIIMIFRLK